MYLQDIALPRALAGFKEPLRCRERQEREGTEGMRKREERKSASPIPGSASELGRIVRTRVFQRNASSRTAMIRLGSVRFVCGKRAVKFRSSSQHAPRTRSIASSSSSSSSSSSQLWRDACIENVVEPRAICRADRLT